MRSASALAITRRILLNIGGMANVTWVRRRGDVESALAADTGPGMAIIDAVARLVDPALPFDANGALAARGTVRDDVLHDLLAQPFFAAPPPRSTGREQFWPGLRRGTPPPGSRSRRGPDGGGADRGGDRAFCDAYLPAAPEVVAAGGGTRHPGADARARRPAGVARGPAPTIR